eukprot:g2136.t1
MSFLVYKDLLQSTGVDHAVFTQFTGTDDINLCAIRGKMLEIYAIIRERDGTASDDENDDDDADDADGDGSEGSGQGTAVADNNDDSETTGFTYTLRLRTQYTLYGCVDSVQVVNFPAEEDCSSALLLTFSSQKQCSLVAYDPEHPERLRILSMHNFRMGSSGTGASTQHTDSQFDNEIDRCGLALSAVDPQNRCAAVLTHDEQLAIIPLKQGSAGVARKGKAAVDERADKNEHGRDDELSVGAFTKLALKPYIISLSKLELHGPVRDLVFLEGYYEPTLLLLQEVPKRTWASFLSNSNHTCRLVAISLNIAQRRHPCIWNFENLPFDCTRVIGVPPPHGGALVISTSAILYFNQNRRCGVAVNGFAGASVDRKECPVKVARLSAPIALDSCSTSFLDPTHLLLSLRGGELYILELLVNVGIVYALNVKRAGQNASANLASCICSIECAGNFGFIFMGSALTDSLLLKYRRVAENHEWTSQELVGGGLSSAKKRKADSYTPAGKKLRIEDFDVKDEKVTSPSGGGAGGADDADEDEDDDMLYGDSASGSTSSSSGTISMPSGAGKGQDEERRSFHFEPCDRIINAGPLTDMITAPTIGGDDSSDSHAAFATSGFGRGGSVNMMTSPMQVHVSVPFKLKGKCKAVFTLKGLDDGSGSNSNDVDDDDDDDDDDDENNTGYIILTVGKSTRVLETLNWPPQQVADDKSPFRLDTQTLCAANVSSVKTGKKYIVQVYASGVRVIGLKKKTVSVIHEAKFSGALATSAKILDPVAIVQMASGELRQITFLSGMKPKVTIIDSTVPSGDKNDSDNVTAYDLFCDADFQGHTNRLFSLPQSRGLQPKRSMADAKVVLKSSKSGANNLDATMDDEDAILYGAADADVTATDAAAKIGGEDDGDDEDDDALYGGESQPPSKRSRVSKSESRSENDDMESRDEELKSDPPNFFLTVAKENGSLDILKFPKLESVFHAPNLSIGPVQLCHTALEEEGAELPLGSTLAGDNGVVVVDISMRYLGLTESGTKAGSTLVLVAALSTGSLLLYRRHPDPAFAGSNVGFLRVPCDIVTRPAKNSPGEKALRNQKGFWKFSHWPLLHGFKELSGRSCLLFSGSTPVWITSERGFPRVHGTTLTSHAGSNSGDGRPPICGSAAFHHSDGGCDHGLVWVYRNGNAIIGDVPALGGSEADAELTFDAPQSLVATKRFMLGETVHKLLRHDIALDTDEISTIFVVLSSRFVRVPSRTTAAAWKAEQEELRKEVEATGMPFEPKPRRPKFIEDDELVELGGKPRVMDELHSVKLMHAMSEEPADDDDDDDDDDEGGGEEDGDDRGVLKMVAIDEYQLMQGERGLCIEHVSLVDEETKVAEKFIVVGTGFVTHDGEDVSGRGRVLIFRLSRINTAQGTKILKLHLVSEKSCRSGVMALAQMRAPQSVAESSSGGFLLAAAGRILEMFSWRSDTLHRNAFYDAQICTVNINVVKDYILVADVYKSIQFVRWRPDLYSLTMLGRDIDPLEVFSSELMVNGKSLLMVVADAHQNLRVYQYMPERADARLGQRLICTGDVHVGAKVSCFAKRLLDKGSHTSACIFGTVIGGVGALLPVEERVFRRLAMLQVVMSRSLPHDAGLNPRAFRACRNGHKAMLKKRANGILDGSFLSRFLSLNRQDQRTLARSIGTSPEIIVENLRCIQVDTFKILQ